MNTTPTLPLQPAPDSSMTIKIAGRDVEIDTFRASTMHEYALAAYQAGRDAGLEAAAVLIDGRRMDQYIPARRVRTLKSGTKGGL